MLLLGAARKDGPGAPELANRRDHNGHRGRPAGGALGGQLPGAGTRAHLNGRVGQALSQGQHFLHALQATQPTLQQWPALWLLADLEGLGGWQPSVEAAAFAPREPEDRVLQGKAQSHFLDPACGLRVHAGALRAGVQLERGSEHLCPAHARGEYGLHLPHGHLAIQGVNDGVLALEARDLRAGREGLELREDPLRGLARELAPALLHLGQRRLRRGNAILVEIPQADKQGAIVPPLETQGRDSHCQLDFPTLVRRHARALGLQRLP
mmetsp:Transcript_11194/g.35524  ORF Transcript_11194/g.35524 Transcript_11194/m.35524 type:complete len:267 (-) Transcript_11194:351-1151(-)